MNVKWMGTFLIWMGSSRIYCIFQHCLQRSRPVLHSRLCSVTLDSQRICTPETGSLEWTVFKTGGILILGVVGNIKLEYGSGLAGDRAGSSNAMCWL